MPRPDVERRRQRQQSLERSGDFELFANKFYDWLPNFGTVYADNVHCDRHSDLISYDQGRDAIATGTHTVPEGDGDYTGAYDRIRRCNLLIQNAGRYGGTTESIRQSLGEAYFFRAWNYFQLLQEVRRRDYCGQTHRY